MSTSPCSEGAGQPEQLLCVKFFKLSCFTPSQCRKQWGGGAGKRGRKVLFVLAT